MSWENLNHHYLKQLNILDFLNLSVPQESRFEKVKSPPARVFN